MQNCPYCKVTVAGDKVCCPLCGGQLLGMPDPETEVFPKMPKEKYSQNFVMRLLVLIAVAVSIICMLINIAVNTEIWWSVFVILGAVSVLLAAAIGIANRRDIIQNIAWQVFLIFGITIFWDWWTGWRGWSLDFVLPSVCAVGLICIFSIAVLLKKSRMSFVSSFLACAILGIVPLVLVLLQKVKVVLPSLICSGISMVLLTGVVIFQWQTIKTEVAKRFHI